MRSTADDDHIPLSLHNTMFNIGNNWKDRLVRNLYSTIEFLKDELIQKLLELQKNELYYKKDVERKNRNNNSSISDN